MQIINCDQRSTEWRNSRLGIPTASGFENILTATGKIPTKSKIDNYRNQLLAEWLAGEPLETYTSQWMQRGIDTEAEALETYEFENNLKITQVGFCLDDSGDYGCSPDGLIGEDGLLEIKVPAPHTHVSYLLADKFPTKYIPQVQGQLLVTGRKWCDFFSYNPNLDSFTTRVERDEDYINTLKAEVIRFNMDIVKGRQVLTAKGYQPIQVTA